MIAWRKNDVEKMYFLSPIGPKSAPERLSVEVLVVSLAIFSIAVDVCHTARVREISEVPITYNRTAIWPGDSEFKNEAADIFHNKISDLDDEFTVSQVSRLVLDGKGKSATVLDIYLHQYESLEDRRAAAGPHVNQEACIKQLEQLNQRADKLDELGINSRDVNLFHLLDTFGRNPGGLLLGNTFWIGEYRDCLNLKIKFKAKGGKSHEELTRYCIASTRLNDWPRGGINDLIVVSSGICLPKTCDSMRYANKYELIFKLMQRRTIFGSGTTAFSNQSEFVDLYCLPDEDSPLRMWYWKPRALMIAVALVAWICLLIYATLRSSQAEKEINSPEVFKDLSIKNNLKRLLATKEQSIGKDASADQKKPLVDLKIIAGIKVISTFYVVMGHVTLLFSYTVANMRSVSLESMTIFHLTNAMPAFTVNVFLVITGILTSYSIFKHQQYLEETKQAKGFFMTSSKWTAFIVMRCLRFMPMYIVGVLLISNLAKYLGSGPLWDYGTGRFSGKKICENQSWHSFIMYLMNVTSYPLDFCIPQAWYLAVDFQFALVTPLFIMAIRKNPTWGKRLIIFSIFLSCAVNVYAIMSAELAEAAKTILSLAPTVFIELNAYLSFSYFRPQYRIHSYLSGLLLGLCLHDYELRQRKVIDKKKDDVDTATDLDIAMGTTHSAGGWPKWFTSHGNKLCLLIMSVPYCLMVLNKTCEFSQAASQLVLALEIPTSHFSIGFSIGLYLLLSSTGYGNHYLDKVLSLGVWKILARLNLGVLLWNSEVIYWIAGSMDRMIFVSEPTAILANSVCIALCYAWAALIFLFFEAPLGGLLQRVQQMLFPA